MGKLTTHVLDTASGKPGAGIRVQLFSMQSGRNLVASAVTNEDGRTDAPLLAAEQFQAGCYELEFAVGDYFKAVGANIDDPPFLADVVIRVTLADDNYHVPLLVSPWSYSTYRGS